MNTTKLTLSIPKNILKEAKAYAKLHKTSVSSIVTRLFQALKEKKQVAPQGERGRTAVITASSVGMISLPSKKSKADLVSEGLTAKYPKK